MSATRTRSCRTCQTRFVPFLVTDAVCGACLRTARDRELVVSHLRDARFTSVEATAAAAGVPPAVVQGMVEDGTIEALAGECDGVACSCPPGSTGRCPACRRRLADGFRALGGPARPLLVTPGSDADRRQSGLRARRGA